MLSLAMKEETAVGFREMNQLSLAMKNEITAGFQELKINDDGRYYTKLTLLMLILVLSLQLKKSINGLLHHSHLRTTTLQ